MSSESSTERYCDIRATTLQEVLETCERHVRNITRTEMDLITEGDGTESDFWYIDMFRRTWLDLHADVKAMLNG
jgi:hypothetical protein